MPLGVQTRVGPWKHVLDGCPDPASRDTLGSTYSVLKIRSDVTARYQYCSHLLCRPLPEENFIRCDAETGISERLARKLSVCPAVSLSVCLSVCLRLAVSLRLSLFRVWIIAVNTLHFLVAMHRARHKSSLSLRLLSASFSAHSNISSRDGNETIRARQCPPRTVAVRPLCPMTSATRVSS